MFRAFGLFDPRVALSRSVPVPVLNDDAARCVAAEGARLKSVPVLCCCCCRLEVGWFRYLNAVDPPEGRPPPETPTPNPRCCRIAAMSAGFAAFVVASSPVAIASSAWNKTNDTYFTTINNCTSRTSVRGRGGEEVEAAAAAYTERESQQ